MRCWAHGAKGGEILDGIRLRGHHLLCLLGYRGMGYSPEYVENMTAIHNRLRVTPQTPVMLVGGVDDLCDKFPLSQEYHCEDDNVNERDHMILEYLGIQRGDMLPWRNIQSQLATVFHPSDINVLCPTCSCRKYGVCAEGIQAIRDGQGLPKIP